MRREFGAYCMGFIVGGLTGAAVTLAVLIVLHRPAPQDAGWCVHDWQQHAAEMCGVQETP